MRELATATAALGLAPAQDPVRREKMPVGYDRFLRIYRANGAPSAAAKKRKVRYIRGNGDSAGNPSQRALVDRLHARSTHHGRTIRAMNIVDDFTRECLAFESAFRLGATTSSGALRTWPSSEAFQKRFASTMAPSLQATRCCDGARNKVLNCTSRSRQADAERAHRIAQRPHPRRAAQHAGFLTIFEARRAAEDWRTITRVPAAFFARKSDAEGVRRSLQNQPTLTTIRGLKLPYTSVPTDGKPGTLRTRQSLNCSRNVSNVGDLLSSAGMHSRYGYHWTLI